MLYLHKILVSCCFLFFLFPLHSKTFELTIIAFPNPFNPSSQILTVQPSKNTSFSLDSTLFVTIYDILFKKVLEDNQQRGTFRWSGFTASGRRVSPGLYYLKIIEERADKSVGSSQFKVLVR